MNKRQITNFALKHGFNAKYSGKTRQFFFTLRQFYGTPYEGMPSKTMIARLRKYGIVDTQLKFSYP